MKKRLRKRLHIKEFTEYGIEFEMKVTSPIKEEAFNNLMEQFVEDFVERNGLFCGGAGIRKREHAVLLLKLVAMLRRFRIIYQN